MKLQARIRLTNGRLVELNDIDSVLSGTAFITFTSSNDYIAKSETRIDLSKVQTISLEVGE